MAGQLVFPFGVEPALGREDFILAPCNEQAIQFIKRWPDWPTRTAAIFGPAHCGKTHLAAIWQSMTNAQTVSARDVISSSAEAVFGGRKGAGGGAWTAFSSGMGVSPLLVAGLYTTVYAALRQRGEEGGKGSP